MSERDIKDLLTAATELADLRGSRPSAREFEARRRARRRAGATVVASIAVVAVVVTLAVSLARLRSSTSPVPHAPSPSSGHVSSEQLRQYRWHALPTPPIPGRTSSTVVWTGSKVILWGGWSRSFGLRNDGAAYDPGSRRWQRLPTSPLSARTDALSVWTGREMIVWGGSGRGGHPLDDGATFEPATQTWTRLPAAPASLADFGRELVWTGRDAIVIGLNKGFGATIATAAAYDPTSNTWRELPDIAAHSTGVYTDATPAMIGGRLVVWVTNSGAYALNRTATAWIHVPLSPSAAGCVSQVIWTGTSILFPPSFYSISCGGDLVFTPTFRGVQLNLRTRRVERMSYGRASTTDPAFVWTGAALLAADGIASYDVGRGANQQAGPGLTASWNPATNRWTRLESAPVVYSDATWIWTGRELIGWGRFDTGSHHNLAGLVFAPRR